MGPGSSCRPLACPMFVPERRCAVRTSDSEPVTPQREAGTVRAQADSWRKQPEGANPPEGARRSGRGAGHGVKVGGVPLRRWPRRAASTAPVDGTRARSKAKVETPGLQEEFTNPVRLCDAGTGDRDHLDPHGLGYPHPRHPSGVGIPPPAALSPRDPPLPPSPHRWQQRCG